jgi:MoaA/NifB/PqqE/SkfB family radical SAM enzyme
MRKLDLKVGYSCNNMCRHCVQGDKRHRIRDKTPEEIAAELKEVRSRGIRSVVFTGGEATVRPDIIEQVALARELGYEVIQVQTNARMFSSAKFTKCMVEAGMTELASALNGHIPELHDYISRVPGAWKQTVQGIKNVREYGIPVLSNTVVTRPNYRFLKEIAELLLGLGVVQYQLAFVHPAGRAWTDFDQLVPNITLAAPYIHRGLDPGIERGVRVMSEAMPFCHMKGYEQYVAELIIPPSDVYETELKIVEWEKWRVNEGKWKGEKCRACRFYDVCEGPWREYVEKRGESEFVPVPGDKVGPDFFSQRRR